MNEQAIVEFWRDPENFVRRIVAEQIAERDVQRVATSDDSALLKVKDVMRLKGVSQRTVYDWVAKNLIRHSYTPGGQLRFRREDVDNCQLHAIESAPVTTRSLAERHR